MYDIERIGKIIADLEHYIIDLEKLKVESPAMSTERFYSLSMLLFAILNRTIDLGQEIIRGKKLGMPASYREIFQILEKEKIISGELAQKMQYLASQRNVLAHEYFDVTERSIFAIFLKTKAVKEFVAVVRKFLREKKKKKSR
ncbi:MAG: DUF86 domain-containing protein [Nanoarchaeota archaeon]|nr:DUF86 domain-containing protein [Nanoarchaeota archaeon]